MQRPPVQEDRGRKRSRSMSPKQSSRQSSAEPEPARRMAADAGDANSIRDNITIRAASPQSRRQSDVRSRPPSRADLIAAQAASAEPEDENHEDVTNTDDDYTDETPAVGRGRSKIRMPNSVTFRRPNLSKNRDKSPNLSKTRDKSTRAIKSKKGDLLRVILNDFFWRISRKPDRLQLDDLCDIINGGVQDGVLPAGDRISSKAAIQQWFRSKRFEVRNTLMRACSKSIKAEELLQWLGNTFQSDSLAVLHEVSHPWSQTAPKPSKAVPIPTARHRQRANVASRDQIASGDQSVRAQKFFRLDENGDPYPDDLNEEG